MRPLCALVLAGAGVLPSGRAGAEAHGCRDVGIFSDLDEKVRLDLPAGLDKARLEAVHDPARGVLVLYEGDHPVKVYPAGGGALRPRDKAELEPLLGGRAARTLEAGALPRPGDRDRDGIPDPLDILIGAKKLLLNAAAYTEGYKPVPFPGGDVPRQMGVCTDVLVRALRNAGLDLQGELYADIARAPRAYPMVKKRNPSIDHRRVRTLAPFFRRHFLKRGVDPRDARDPYRAGDIVFMDTFPSRPGPDHVGIISDRKGASGLPLVINNWAPGSEDSEMDLLPFVPVTERFRLPAEAPAASTRRAGSRGR